MFYLQGLGVTRSDKFGLIWLAGNYDPDKYRKMITSRDCEKANICKLCNAIMNPTVPFALRLSAHLMLGTVRVYRTKTKLCLELAEQVRWKLNSLIREANKQYRTELTIPFARNEAVTLVPPQQGVVDYSIEPYYFDAQLIMHMNDSDFFSNPTPVTSPIKFTKPLDDKQDQKNLKSPLKVRERQISFEENLLSPRKADDVPLEETDYLGGFTAMQDDQILMDLDVPNIIDNDNMPQEKFISGANDGRLSPVFETAGMETVFESVGMETEDKIMKDDHERVVRKLLADDDVISEQVRNILNPPEFMIHKPQDGETRKRRLNDGIVEEKQSIADDGTSQTSQRGFDNEDRSTTSYSKEQQNDWANEYMTPSNTLILEPHPLLPRKKRKLMVDQQIILDSDTIRNSIQNTEDIVSTPNLAGSVFAHGAEMIKKPMFRRKRRSNLETIWNKNVNRVKPPSNKKQRKIADVSDIATMSGYDTMDEEIERARQNIREGGNLIDTPATIEVPRDGSAAMLSIDQSGGSMMLINQTPVEGSLTKSYDDGMMMETTGAVFRPTSPRISDIAPLNEPFPEINVDLYPVPEEEGQGLLVEDEVAEYRNDNTPSKGMVHHQRMIKEKLEKEKSFEFSKMFSKSHTSRRDAALAFYTLLHSHKNGHVVISQNEMFGEIYVSQCKK